MFVGLFRIRNIIGIVRYIYIVRFPNIITMETINQIQKMHRETGVPELKHTSRLTGNETQSELNHILEKCQCIQIAVLFNGFNKK
ncbi:hypothetical protein LCGC14_0729830 [marine sediment metagenome]|uniref:Uncharacterized protein n=1 Tax=marine sediment metagenome TaxID=412755 RepID=A0A0F9QUY5_9ZZZZ